MGMHILELLNHGGCKSCWSVASFFFEGACILFLY
uniref:Uncharacterized protein n=1 Tax=Arundo donax TaxID=35708 RepID=A0A0A9GWB1_ARUDO